jgi:methylated-DNA-[protein]-cysteine S-methyltransferase
VPAKKQEKINTVTICHPLTPVTIQMKRSKDGVVVESISFGHSGQAEKSINGKIDDPDFRKIAGKITRYLDGRATSLKEIPIDLTWCTEFQRKVLAAARKISRGSVISYAELAKEAGYPAAVRAAASVMRNNRFPLVIPCHRVIRKDGKIGGFMGVKYGNPVVLKRKFLALEGVGFFKKALKNLG